MSTIRKTLKDKDGNYFCPAIPSRSIEGGDIKLGAVKAENIDFTTLLDILHPVGSYYETSDTAFNPNTAWGGTWVEDTWGRVTVAYQSDQPLFDQVGEIGGEIEHTLTIAEMPKHVHNVSRFYGGTGFSTPYGDPYNGWGLHSNDNSGQNDIYTTNTGESNAHNNLQPYIVVKRWHRTA